MPEAVLTPLSDKTAAPQHLTDAQVGEAVANRFFSDVHQALTGAQMDEKTFLAKESAFRDLTLLHDDPQQAAVLNAIANQIESHAPYLGIVQGAVERDKDGHITGFKFTNPQTHQAYEDSLPSVEKQGFTLKEAEEGSNAINETTIKGVMEIPSEGNLGNNPISTSPADSGRSNAHQVPIGTRPDIRN